MKIVYFILDKALSSYYSAMEEQVSIIITIILYYLILKRYLYKLLKQILTNLIKKNM